MLEQRELQSGNGDNPRGINHEEITMPSRESLEKRAIHAAFVRGATARSLQTPALPAA
jgi:hypothetical protein